MSDTRFPMTARGHQRLKEELHRLKTEDRPQVIQAIADARRHGDLSENAEYHAAKENQRFIEDRISHVELKLRHAEVIRMSQVAGDTIAFSATVELMDEATEQKITYQIVGEDEADIKAGLLSIKSPLARALVGKSVGDACEVTAPGGSRVYEVLSISYEDSAASA